MTTDEVCGLDQFDPHRKSKLTSRIYASKDGKPLKTALAREFPHLSRQERRSILRSARKAEKKQERASC